MRIGSFTVAALARKRTIDFFKKEPEVTRDHRVIGARPFVIVA